LTVHEQNRYQRLKEELRRLRRPAAPWYLESELHRRLHSPHKRISYVGVAPILIIATTLVTLSIAVYVTLINPLLLPREVPATPSATVVPVQRADSQMAAVSPVRRVDSAAAKKLLISTPRTRASRDSLRTITAGGTATRRKIADSAAGARPEAPVLPSGEEMALPDDTIRAK
jgi:hypothetical protein